jgi:hypothetical protein
MFILAILASWAVQIHLLRRAAAGNGDEIGKPSQGYAEVSRKTPKCNHHETSILTPMISSDQ